MTSTFKIQVIECESKSGALQEADAGGWGEAVFIDGAAMVVPHLGLDRLAGDDA